MLWADSEEIFLDAVNNVKSLVPPSNIDLMDYVDELSVSRREYTKYVIQSYYGNKFLLDLVMRSQITLQSFIFQPRTPITQKNEAHCSSSRKTSSEPRAKLYQSHEQYFSRIQHAENQQQT